MSAPAPLSAADLEVLASSVLERVELVAMTAELGGAPPERTVASVVASALELHRELARTLDASSAQEDGDLLARVSGTVERLNDALAIVADGRHRVHRQGGEPLDDLRRGAGRRGRVRAL